MPVLYFLFNGVYALVYYVFGYRKKIVLDNLRHAFPEKTEKERIRIAKNFYHNLVNSFAETVKLVSAGKKFINKRCRADFSIFHELHRQGKPFQVHAGHQFNWEMLNLHWAQHIPQPLVAVYMPLSNKIFEKIFYNLRTRYGTVMLPATDMKNHFATWRSREHALVLVADQNPGHPGNSYWFNFLNRPAPFVKGPERGAREKRVPVVFAFVHKLKRGHYETRFIKATDDAGQLPETELTRKYLHFLSQIIREQPDMWLWSHRRWKWHWKEEYGPILE